MGCVYRIVNVGDRKSYVGQTIHALEHRMKGHLHAARRGRGLLGRAMKKHGIDRFQWYVLCDNVEENGLDVMERFYVAYFNTNVQRGGWGYNLDDGGRSRKSGFKHTDVSRWMMRASRATFLSNHPEHLQLFSVVMKRVWRDPVYRDKNMVKPSVSFDELRCDGQLMTWDAMASKHAVSVSTVKKWVTQLGVMKKHVPQSRRPWTVDEEGRLMAMYDDGKLVRTMAVELGRSECSVKKRVQLLCDRRGTIRQRYRRGT